MGKFFGTAEHAFYLSPCNVNVLSSPCSDSVGKIMGLVGGTPNTGSSALFDRRTGFQPVRADRASRLSAAESTGWKPVGQDMRDACPPAKLTVLGGTPTLLDGGGQAAAGIGNPAYRQLPPDFNNARWTTALPHRDWQNIKTRETTYKP